MAKKRFSLVVSLIILLGLMPRGAWAYGPDIHFSFTYVLCRLVGIEVNDSLWIAAADQSMDDNISTTAFPGVFGTLKQRGGNDRKEVYFRNGRLFHAFSDAGVEGNENPLLPAIIQYQNGGARARKEICDRLHTLHNRVPAGSQLSVSENERITADIAFGQFLHYAQDYYSHRQLTPDRDNDNAYLPYGTHWGHAVNNVMPDEVVRYPGLAKKMALNSYGFICDYAKSAFGKLPNRDLQLDALIDAVAKSYPVYYGKSSPHTTNYDFPDSKQVNDKLQPCLTQFFSTIWPGPKLLPIYTEEGWNLVLPYDNPKTSLQPIIKNFQDETRNLVNSH